MRELRNKGGEGTDLGVAAGEVPGKASLTQQLQRRSSAGSPPVAALLEPEAAAGFVPEPAAAHDDPFGLHLVQAKADGSGAEHQDARIHEVAQAGVAEASQTLPHLEAIQRSFGPHDIQGIRAQVGGAAATASREIGASAYATGDAVAFAETPDLHTAAHEAAHVVQQRGGVQLKGGIGEVGDPYEQNADAVADRVVRGESAVDLLPAGSHGGGAGVQRQADASPAAGAQRSAADLLAEAIDVIETALAVATGEIGDADAGARADGAAADPESAEPAPAPAASSPGTSPAVVEHLQTALAGLNGLRGASEEAIRTAVTPILAHLGAPGVSGASGAGAAAAAPVQRNTLVLGAPLLAAGPPGWVAYAVLGVVSVGIIGYAGYQTYRSRARERERAEPRVEPRTRDRPQQHRGRIQVQGGGLELAFPWARSTPMTKVEGLAGLAGLEAMLSQGDLSLRNEAFVSAAAFITATLHTCPPDISRTFQNRAVRQRGGTERVDVEIRTGVAFV